MAKKRFLSLILVFVMIISLLPTGVFAADGDSDTLHQLLFMSDIHSGTYAIDKDGIPGSQFSNLKYMCANLKKEGLNPEAITCGGDYTRDTYADYSDWNEMYNIIEGTFKANFPNAQTNYTMGNHEWETMSLGAGSDKEALFEKIFGYPRCGLRMETDDYAIYQIGAQGNNRAGVDKEIFFTQDIQDLDNYLSTQIGQQRVIFIQSHWPIHSGWNFNYRNITNADLMIQTLNKYAEYMDIVYFWGHNHYGDPMRQTVKKAGDTITYYAQQGQPSRTRTAQIGFTYVSTGCMNDMWNLQTGGFDMDPGTGVCSFVDIKADKVVINYRHVENTLSENPIYDDNANFKSYRPNENVNRIDPPQIFENPSRIEIPLLHTEFGAAKQYSVKVTNSRGGTASADVTMCAAGEEVTLTATPKDGFRFKEWQVVGDANVTIQDGKFTMPESHVAVKAVFESNSMASETIYELADEIAAGERYVIVANGYALRSAVVTDSVVAEGVSLASVPVTVEDDVVTSDVSEDMIWTFAEGSSPDAPGYEGFYITSNEGKLLYRNRLGGKSAANLTLNDMPAASSINRVFWIVKDLENGAKSLVQIGQTSNSSDYVFFLQASAESFNAPYSQRDAWESSYANHPVKLYKLTETTPAGLPCIDFTDPAEESKFEIINSTGTSIVEGTGLKLVCTRPAFETCNGQNSGDQATTPADVVSVPVSGDWTATLTVDFSTGSANNGYYQFFGFYAAEGEDYQNLAGIRGGDGAMQNFLRVNGNITADSSELNSAPGFASVGTYYLRLTKEGTSYICERSSNGEDFTTMFTYEDTGIEADQILLDAYTGMTTGYEFTLKALDFEGGQSIPSCDHVTELQGVKEATCNEDGYTGDAVCTKCGKVITTGEVALALGHDWDDGVVTKPATETEDGVLTYTCSRCDGTSWVVIPALGTDPTPAAVTYELATTIEAGEKYVIVANGYAMNSVVSPDSVTNSGTSLGATAVTVEGSKIVSDVADNMIWSFETGSSPDAPGYTGFYVYSDGGKMLYRNRLGGKSAASLTLEDKPADASLNRVFWVVKDIDNAGTKSLVQIGQVNNDSDYVFFVGGSAESFNAPYSQRESWESAFSSHPVKLYKVTTGTPDVPVEPEDLAIVTEPVDFVGKVGETAKFAVEVNRTDVTYQWMWSKDGGKTWEASEQTGFDTAEVSVVLKSFRNGQMYKVVVTDSTGATVESAAVKMSTPTQLKITENPADVTVAVNQAAAFTVKAEGEGLTYQWMYSNNGGSYWSISTADGAATPSMTIAGKTFRNGQMYKCVVTDASGNVVESAPATMTVG